MGNYCVRNVGGVVRTRDINLTNNSKERIDFTKLEWKNTKPYIPKVEEGFVIKVYDGDTITVATSFEWEPETAYRFSVRILGIDTPEKRTKDENEKYVAEKAKDFVSEKILRKFVVLRNVSTDKYGRLLADVYPSDSNISIGEELIKNKLAVKYDGGTKKTPDNWREYYESK